MIKHCSKHDLNYTQQEEHQGTQKYQQKLLVTNGRARAKHRSLMEVIHP